VEPVVVHPAQISDISTSRVSSAERIAGVFILRILPTSGHSAPVLVSRNPNVRGSIGPRAAWHRGPNPCATCQRDQATMSPRLSGMPWNRHHHAATAESCGVEGYGGRHGKPRRHRPATSRRLKSSIVSAEPGSRRCYARPMTMRQ
jgi:hypothetical protein